jgi:hypothetical protein
MMRPEEKTPAKSFPGFCQPVPRKEHSTQAYVDLRVGRIQEQGLLQGTLCLRQLVDAPEKDAEIVMQACVACVTLHSALQIRDRF